MTLPVVHHLGALHPVELVLVALLAFGPFVALGIVVHVQRRRDASDEQAAAAPPMMPMRATRDSVRNIRPLPRTRIDAPVCLTQPDAPMKTDSG